MFQELALTPVRHKHCGIMLCCYTKKLVWGYCDGCHKGGYLLLWGERGKLKLVNGEILAIFRSKQK